MKSLLVLVMLCVAGLSFSGNAKASESKEALFAKIEAASAEGANLQLVYSWSELGGDAYDLYTWIKGKMVDAGLAAKDLGVTGFWAAWAVISDAGCLTYANPDERHACFAKNWDEVMGQLQNNKGK